MSSPTLYANSQLVAQAWLASLPGLTAAMIGRSLPAESAWAGSAGTTGYIVVNTTGGTPSVEIPFYHPVVTCYPTAKQLNSDVTTWGLVENLSQIIERGCQNWAGTHLVLALTENGVTYPSASVVGVKAVQHGRPVFGDTGDLTQYRVDIQLDWTDAP